MPSHSGPADLLAALARALRERGFGSYVFGAQAALIWGRPRLTTDVDVTVGLGSHDAREFVEMLGKHGFRLRTALQQLQVQLARPLPYDLDGMDLAEYRQIAPRWRAWERVSAACTACAAGIFERISAAGQAVRVYTIPTFPRLGRDSD